MGWPMPNYKKYSKILGVYYKKDSLSLPYLISVLNRENPKSSVSESVIDKGDRMNERVESLICSLFANWDRGNVQSSSPPAKSEFTTES